MAAAILVVACVATAAERAAELEQALRKLDAALDGVRHMSPSDLLGDMRSARYASARAVIRSKQCASGTSNPLVIMSRQPRISVKGRFDPQGADVTGNSFDIPLYVVAVADLPGEYLKQAGALVDGLLLEDVRRLRAQLPAQHEVLETRVSALMASFDPDSCGRVGAVRPGPASTVFMPPSY